MMQLINLLTVCQVLHVPYFVSSSLQLYKVRGNHSIPAQSASNYSFMILISKMELKKSSSFPKVI